MHLISYSTSTVFVLILFSKKLKFLLSYPSKCLAWFIIMTNLRSYNRFWIVCSFFLIHRPSLILPLSNKITISPHKQAIEGNLLLVYSCFCLYHVYDILISPLLSFLIFLLESKCLAKNLIKDKTEHASPFQNRKLTPWIYHRWVI